MRILSVHVGHDASACLIEDGEIIRYIQEERFTRIKAVQCCPLNSVKFVLGNYKIDEIDVITMPSGLVPSIRPSFDALWNKYEIHVPSYLRDYFFEINKESISQIGHHYCHAASTYYTSGLKSSLIITCDGVGEIITQNVCLGENGKIKPVYLITQNGLYKSDALDIQKVKGYTGKMFSWGFYYSMVTEALGWRTFDGEGKTMGLAPYGKYNEVLYKAIKKEMYNWVEIGHWNIAGITHHHYYKVDYYIDLIKTYGREDFAYNAQKVLEDRVIRFIKFWLKQTKQKNLCLAGGVFLNVKLNQRIKEECNLNNFWVFPLAGDAGVCIGAGLTAYYTNNEYEPKRLKHIYWGDEFNNKEIEEILRRDKVKYIKYDVNKAAKLLFDNKIIARFKGRMEAGPRALGNRSILMSPLKAENKDIINKFVKFREPFRPFCPSVIKEKAKKYFDGDGEFMIVGCNVKTKDIPAVTHVDNTARPQLVSKGINPEYYELLNEFGKLSGHPVLLNTSFNIKGEPIIRTPDEAIRCFYGTGLDALIIGDYLVVK